MFGSRNRNGGGGGGGGRQVCHFFLEGRCRFGDNCKNEHPRGQDNPNAQVQGQNRFAPLQNPGGGARGRSGAFGSQGQTAAPQKPTFQVTRDGIKLDLTEERPNWPLSAYGPGRNAPVQLLEGDFEQSPEEMRLLHYLALAAGNPQETTQREQQTTDAVNQAIQRILNDLDGAVNYVVDGNDRHPNRIDMEKKDANDAASQPTPSAFGAPSTSSGFGQNSAFGQASAPQPSQSAFGQPSAMGTASAFGQPSAPAQTSGFGQPSALGSQPKFGQSSLGQTTQPSSAFGQAPQTSAFGQPSAFGAAAGASPAFGQPSQPQSAFGQPSQPQSAFGQPSQPQSAFGQPSTFAAPASGSPSPFAAAGQSQPQNQSAFGQASAFGAAARQSSPFAQASQPSQQTQSAFGQPSAFGAAASNNQSPFATSSQTQSQPTASPFATSQPPPATQSNPFSQPQSAPNQPTASAPTAFGQPSPFAQASAPQSSAPQPMQASNGPPGSTAHLTHTAQGTLTSFKGQRVIYKDEPPTPYYTNPATRKDVRIWFPSGPPAGNNDTEAPEAMYTGDLGKSLEEIYRHVSETGTFGEGGMPEIPPKRDWVGWNL